MNTVADELRDVTAAQGIPAGEHEEWRPRAKGGYPVDQPLSLLGREFSWIAVGERLRATMDAREGTGTSHFPDDDERSSLEGGDLGRGLYCVDRRCLMSDYQLALVFHLFGASSLVAGTVVAGVAFEAARRRGAPSEIARLLGLTRIGVLFVGAGFVVALAFGLWLVRIAQWGYGSSWIEAAYGLLAASAVLGTVGGQPPKRARMLAVRLAAEQTQTTPELRGLLDDHVARAADYLSALALIAIIVVMVVKPGF